MKLQGIAFRQMQGGYLAFSVSPKDLKIALELLKHLDPHFALAEVIEEVVRETEKIQKVHPANGELSVPFGLCILSTNEIFSHRHKILERNVRAIGTFTITEKNGRVISVQVYSGAPTANERTQENSVVTDPDGQ